MLENFPVASLTAGINGVNMAGQPVTFTIPVAPVAIAVSFPPFVPLYSIYYLIDYSLYSLSRYPYHGTCSRSLEFGVSSTVNDGRPFFPDYRVTFAVSFLDG